jgi:hypothetical protein
MPEQALAWGDQGHSLTCQIAYELMTPKTRKTVDALIQRQAPRYRNFANACTYADDAKDTDGRRNQHFVNLHRNDTGLTELACPVANSSTDCLLFAIKHDYGVIRDPAASEDARSLALLYLGHWIGDLHQPLHVSFRDDLGGNDVLTAGACGGGKLHSTWDTCMIVQRIYANRPGVAMIDDPRFVAAAQDLAAEISASEMTAWNVGEPWQWANESFTIARTSKVQYCKLKAGACWYDATHQKFQSGPKRTVTINNAYIDRFAPTVSIRLQMGGARLAGLLNAVFDPTSPVAEAPKGARNLMSAAATLSASRSQRSL